MNIFTSLLQNIVAGFQKTFGHPLEEKPTLAPYPRIVARTGFGVLEERVELLFNAANSYEEFENAVEAMHKAIDVAAAKQRVKELVPTDEKLENIADALGDELWFLLGDCCEYGIDIAPIIEIINDSNNSKLFTAEDGTKYAMNDERGKIIKSPEFFPPEKRIKEEIKRQLSQ